jgi:hypothetical protein
MPNESARVDFKLYINFLPNMNDETAGLRLRPTDPNLHGSAFFLDARSASGMCIQPDVSIALEPFYLCLFNIL